MDSPIKHATDVASAGVLTGVWIQMLPTFASLFTLVWTALRIIEMFTGKTINQLVKDIYAKRFGSRQDREETEETIPK